MTLPLPVGKPGTHVRCDAVVRALIPAARWPVVSPGCNRPPGSGYVTRVPKRITISPAGRPPMKRSAELHRALSSPTQLGESYASKGSTAPFVFSQKTPSWVVGPELQRDCEYGGSDLNVQIWIGQTNAGTIRFGTPVRTTEAEALSGDS